jgi:hypothetical protein
MLKLSKMYASLEMSKSKFYFGLGKWLLFGFYLSWLTSMMCECIYIVVYGKHVLQFSTRGSLTRAAACNNLSALCCVCVVFHSHRRAANRQIINLTFTSTIKGRVKEAEKSTRTRLLLEKGPGVALQLRLRQYAIF